jgi:hypothetical protein
MFIVPLAKEITPEIPLENQTDRMIVRMIAISPRKSHSLAESLHPISDHHPIDAALDRG